MNKAIVTQDLFDERIETWLKSQNAYKIGIRGGSSALDVAITEGGKKQTEAKTQKVLRRSQYNRQQGWLKSGKPLEDWNGNFHLGNPIIMATWLAGKESASEVIFADVLPEKEVGQKHEKNQFREVMRQLREEFRLDFFYTNFRSQIFKDIGAEEFNPSFKSEIPEPISLPSCNAFSYGKSIEGSNIRVKNKSAIAGAVVKTENKTYTATSVVPENPNRLEGQGLILLKPEDRMELRKALGMFGDEKEVLMLSESAKLEINKLRPEPLTNVSVTALALAMEGYNVTAKLNETSKPAKDFMDRIEEISYV